MARFILRGRMAGRPAERWMLKVTDRPFPLRKEKWKAKTPRPNTRSSVVGKQIPAWRLFCYLRFLISHRAVYRFPLCLRLPIVSSHRPQRLANSSASQRPVWLWSPVCGGSTVSVQAAYTVVLWSST